MWTVADVPAGSNVIVGPHSASPSVIGELKTRCTVVNTSCANVLRVVSEALRASQGGYTVVLLATAGHEEADMVAMASPDVILVTSLAAAAHVPATERMVVVCQSTLSLAALERYQETIRSVNRSAVFIDTTCRATRLRQIDMSRLVRVCTKIVVVGGQHSNNTRALARMSEGRTEVIHVETAGEIPTGWFSEGDVVGITAGASTPDFVIIAAIWHLFRSAYRTPGRAVGQVLSAISNLPTVVFHCARLGLRQTYYDWRSSTRFLARTGAPSGVDSADAGQPGE